jgi:hypothetical protein
MQVWPLILEKRKHVNGEKGQERGIPDAVGLDLAGEGLLGAAKSCMRSSSSFKSTFDEAVLGFFALLPGAVVFGLPKSSRRASKSSIYIIIKIRQNATKKKNG